MIINYPCVCCQKAVKTNQRAILCTNCQKWVHIKCVNISKTVYDDTGEHFMGWQCPICIMQQLPFYNEDICTEPTTTTVFSKISNDSNRSFTDYTHFQPKRV